METKSRNKFLNVLLVVIAVGVWVNVLQNSGLIKPKNNPVVYVSGGDIDASVYGTVEVEGTVEVGNEVDINISSVNGHSANSYGSGNLGVFNTGY